MYFCVGLDDRDNELLTLEVLHRYVELLDKYFGNVSVFGCGSKDAIMFDGAGCVLCRRRSTTAGNGLRGSEEAFEMVLEPRSTRVQAKEHLARSDRH